MELTDVLLRVLKDLHAYDGLRRSFESFHRSYEYAKRISKKLENLYRLKIHYANKYSEAKGDQEKILFAGLIGAAGEMFRLEFDKQLKADQKHLAFGGARRCRGDLPAPKARPEGSSHVTIFRLSYNDMALYSLFTYYNEICEALREEGTLSLKNLIGELARAGYNLWRKRFVELEESIKDSSKYNNKKRPEIVIMPNWSVEMEYAQ